MSSYVRARVLGAPPSSGRRSDQLVVSLVVSRLASLSLAGAAVQERRAAGCSIPRCLLCRALRNTPYICVMVPEIKPFVRDFSCLPERLQFDLKHRRKR